MPPSPNARRPVSRITIRCPISAECRAALVAGQRDAIYEDRYLGPLMRYLDGHATLGDFGRYRGVRELTLGLEIFRPVDGSSPTVGTPGERSLLDAVTVVTYLEQGVSDARLDQILAEIAALHPWEIPVIEIDDCRLYAPSAS